MTISSRSVVFLTLIVSLVTGAYASDRLDPTLLRSVLRIEGAPDPQGNVSTGGGFLMTATEDESGKVFLITNKHMIGDWNYADSDFHEYKPWINVFFYRVGDPSGRTYRPTKIDHLRGTGLDTAKDH
jgi:hypothetical protein